eukprot:262163_1
MSSLRYLCYKAMISKYGTDGAVTQEVINHFCKQNRLRYSEAVGEHNVRDVISRRRPLVACFDLSEEGWDNFSSFFRNNPRGILKRSDITKASGRTYFRVPNDNM